MFDIINGLAVINGLTAQEYFNKNNCLPENVIQYLLGIEMDNSKKRNNIVRIQEASNSFPEEDFMQSTIEEIKIVLDNIVPKSNKDKQEQKNGIITKLEELQDRIYNDGAYGKDELQKAIKEI